MNSTKLFFFLIFTPLLSIAQEEKNLQKYTPSVLLAKGQMEFKSFHSLYTQTSYFNHEKKSTNINTRSSFYTSINEYTLGINSRLNIGAVFWFRSTTNNLSSESALQTLQFTNSDNSRIGLSYLGPKIRFNPFKNVGNFSVNSNLLIPIAKDLEGSVTGKTYLASNSFIWINDLLWDKKVKNLFQLFAKASVWYHLDRDFKKDSSTYLSSPVSLFVTKNIKQRTSIYVLNEFWPTYGNDELIQSYFYQSGIGAKYQIIKGKLEIEALYNDFLFGKNAGNGRSYNVGLRLLN